MDCSFPEARSWYNFYRQGASGIFDREVEKVTRKTVDMLALVLIAMGGCVTVRLGVSSSEAAGSDFRAVREGI